MIAILKILIFEQEAWPDLTPSGQGSPKGQDSDCLCLQLMPSTTPDGNVASAKAEDQHC